MSTETLRETLHGAARMLYQERGKCVNTLACTKRFADTPLADWAADKLCERCAAAWHTLMAAMLIDSVIVAERFADFVVKPVLVPPSDVLLANFAKIWDAAADSIAYTIEDVKDAKDTADDFVEDAGYAVFEPADAEKPRRIKAIKAKAPKAVKTPKAPKKSSKKTAAAASGPFTCKHCTREFKQSNWKTMHERFCEG